MNARQVRRFNLVRDVDVSGVSGTGAVAFGAQAPNGSCVLWWDSEHESIGIYPSMDTLLAIHGHSGSTRAVFLDDDPAAGRAVPPARASRATATRSTGGRAVPSRTAPSKAAGRAVKATSRSAPARTATAALTTPSVASPGLATQGPSAPAPN